ncbi:hypothetical protein JW916_15585 [Candidatus Sumerlaeota bacterium]|nr:hypothetical protein [Candidatus Sumerlaeota bacterium]
MSSSAKVKSPLGLRVLVWSGSVLFSILLFWLLGFVLDDIGRFRRVDRTEIENRFVGKELLDRRQELQDRVQGIQRDIESERERQEFYRDQAKTARETMQQMTELQKKGMELNEARDAQQQQALAGAQKAFLESQDRYNNQAEVVLRKKQELREGETALRELDREIQNKRRDAAAESRRAEVKQNLRAAALKTLVLLPAIVLAFWLFLRKRSGGFAPLVYAVAIAVFFKLLVVIHEHFPREYYKYIFIVAAILGVWRILVHLLRSAASPGRDLLVKRYREAYRRNQCAVCGYPILRGGFHIVQAARKTLGRRVRLSFKPAELEGEGDYTCPSCGQKLFESCSSCRQTRHTLLPSCRHCGDEKDIVSG